MSDQWYYKLFGEEFGPVELTNVAQMLTSGELGSDDKVRRGADGSWVFAGSVPELKRATASVPVNSVAASTPDVADDIDSFMLIDEKASRKTEARQPEMAMDIDSFMLVDEQQKAKPPARSNDLASDLQNDLADDLATDLDSFRIVDEQQAAKSAAPRARAASPEPPPEPPLESRTDPAAAIWYFQGLDTVLGPVTRSELVEMARRAELGPKDLIRKGPKGRWLPSELLEGLFAEAAAPPPAPFVPEPVAPPPAAAQYSAPSPGYAPPGYAAPAPAQIADTGEVIWYCYINDQEYGPMTMTDLRASAAQGSITPQSYVKYGARGEWVAASTMPEIFPPPPPAPVAAVPTFAGADAAGAERTELVQQLLTLLKQGLSADVLGGMQSAAPMVGAGWYCNISGSVIGPVSIESLVQMVLQKRLFPDDMIRMGTTGEWFPAKTVPDLFPASGPQGRAKKPGMDSGESVMERIDRMYREGQEAQAKLDAAKKNEPVRAAAPVESSRSAAGDVLRNVNANIARGNTPSKSSSSSSSSFSGGLGGLEMSPKLIGIIAAVAVVGLGLYFLPVLLSSAATKTAFGKLIAVQAQLRDAEEGGMNPQAWASQSSGMLKQVEEVAGTVKSGASGSAKRDVSRMAKALKEMLETVGKPPPQGAPAGAMTDYQRASKAFDDATKAAAKKLGLK